MHNARFKTVTGRNLALWQSAVAQTIRENNDKTNILKHPLMQAATDHVITTDRGDEISEPKQISKIDFDSMGKTLEKNTIESLKYLSNLRFNIANAKINKDHDLSKKLEEQHNRMFGTDPYTKWIINCEKTYIENYLKYLGTKEYRDWKIQGKNNIDYSLINWNKPTTPVRVGLMADWGTGTEDCKALLDEMIGNGVNVIIHLGDIYYSCTEKECSNIRDIIKARVKDKGILFLMIPGNHDYYSSGREFFTLLDNVNNDVNPNDMKQSASYFCLRINQDIQILGVDTGRNDNNPANLVNPWNVGPDLVASEKEWVENKMNFQGKTILLSHHQLFSYNDAINGKESGKPQYSNERLLKTFENYFSKILAWYWGHEHNMIIFDKNLGLQKGRLIGCSGYEENEQADSPYDVKFEQIKEFDPPKVRLGIEKGERDQGYYNHGYVILDINQDKDKKLEVTADYHQIPSWGDDEGPIPLSKGQEKIIFSEVLD